MFRRAVQERTHTVREMGKTLIHALDVEVEWYNLEERK
jgi:hypothetical protein